MTTQFYTPPDRIAGDRLSLPPDESAHAHKVLRLRAGDMFVAVDGEGGWYQAVAEAVDAWQVAGRIVERRRDVGEPAYRLTVGLSLLKQEKRFAHFVEKASELGVSRVVPLVTARTEKRSYRAERAVHVAIAAMKQCRRSRILEIGDAISFASFLDAQRNEPAFVCHEAASDRHATLGRQIADAGYPDRITVLVGPEGGFHDDEVGLAAAKGARVVSLGDRRLRAETAAIAASAGVMLLYDAR